MHSMLIVRLFQSGVALEFGIIADLLLWWHDGCWQMAPSEERCWTDASHDFICYSIGEDEDGSKSQTKG